MKSCAYCGKDNEDSAIACAGCGTGEFKEKQTAASGSSSPLRLVPDKPSLTEALLGRLPEHPELARASKRHRAVILEHWNRHFTRSWSYQVMDAVLLLAAGLGFGVGFMLAVWLGLIPKLAAFAGGLTGLMAGLGLVGLSTARIFAWLARRHFRRFMETEECRALLRLKTCAKCGYQNDEGLRQCGRCGLPLPAAGHRAGDLEFPRAGVGTHG